MNQYYIFDLAFDWNTSIDKNGNWPLYIGLVSLGGQPPQTGNEYNFNPVTDYFCFNAFNQTSGATQESHLLIGGSITFNSAVTGQVVQSPVNLTSMTISAIGQAGSSGPSNVFPGGTYPAWSPVVPNIQLFTLGKFQFTINLEFQASDGTTKTFVADPEMIVGSVE